MSKHPLLVLALIGAFLAPAITFAAYDFQPVFPLTINGTTVNYVVMSSAYSYVEGSEIASQTVPTGPSMFAPMVDASICDSLAASAGLSSTAHIWCGFKITFPSDFNNCVFTCQGGSGGSMGQSGVSSSSSGGTEVKLYATEPNIGPLASLAPTLTVNPDGTVTWAPAAPGPTIPSGSDCVSVYSFISSGMVSVPGYSPGCYVLTNTVPTTATPTATLSALPASISAGATSALTHSCTNATSASIDNSVGTVDATAGTNSVSPSSSTTYTLTCTGVGGSATATATVTVTTTPPAGAVTATLVANPSTINSGESSILTWGSTNATSCTGTNFSTGNATSGSISTGALSSGITYSVSCAGPSGPATASAHVTVTSTTTTTPGSGGGTPGGTGTTPGGTGTTPGTPGASSLSALLTAFPITVPYGSSSLLSWTSAHATSCTGGNFTTGGATAGTLSVTPAATTLYSLTCTDAAGNNAFSTATVTVVAPSLTITGTPQLVRSGSSTTISWHANGPVHSCSVSGPGLSSTASSGSQTIVIHAESTFTFSCAAGAFSPVVSTTVKVLPAFNEI
ncbi:MAG: hypothetical protein V4437_00245 [Patescibacteria group bacterium]